MQLENKSPNVGGAMDLVSALGSMASDITGMTPAYAMFPVEDVWNLIDVIDGDVHFKHMKPLVKESIDSGKALMEAIWG